MHENRNLFHFLIEINNMHRTRHILPIPRTCICRRCGWCGVSSHRNNYMIRYHKFWGTIAAAATAAIPTTAVLTKLSWPLVRLGRFMIFGQAGWFGALQMCWNYSSGNLQKQWPDANSTIWPAAVWAQKVFLTLITL